MDQKQNDWHPMKKISILFLILIGTGNAFGFEEFNGDGYFWYKDPAKEAKKIEKLQPSPEPPQKLNQEEIPMSSAWLKKNLPELHNRALDNPTEENVANYDYATRVIMDKAQAYASKHKEVVSKDQFLDEENRVPSAQYTNLLFKQAESKSTHLAISYLSTIAGLWLFTDVPAKCSACEFYKNSAIQTLVKKYSFNFMEISVATTNGMAIAKKLNLRVTPSLIFAKPHDQTKPLSDANKDEIYVISGGLLSVDMIEDRMMVAATSNKLLPADLASAVNPYEKGILTKDDIAGLSVGDPTDVMNEFRSRINGNYNTDLKK